MSRTSQKETETGVLKIREFEEKDDESVRQLILKRIWIPFFQILINSYFFGYIAFFIYTSVFTALLYIYRESTTAMYVIIGCTLVYLVCARFVLVHILGAYVLPRIHSMFRKGMTTYWIGEQVPTDKRLWVAEINGKIAGTAGICPLEGFMKKWAKNEGRNSSGEPRAVSLSSMAVSTDYGRRGIGSALMRHVIEYCSQTGLDEVLLGTNAKLKEAVALYHKFGFVDVAHEALMEIFMCLDVKKAKANGFGVRKI